MSEQVTVRGGRTIRIRRFDPAAIGAVIGREAANFRTFWKGTTFNSVLDPTIYLLAFGLGLGVTIVGEVDGIPYVQFVGTGMTAMAVIFSSALPAMFGTFVKHHFQHTYDAILAAPVDTEELVTAEVLWIALRASIYGSVPVVVTMFFGLPPTPAMLLIPLFAFVTAWGFASFGVAVAARATKIDQFNYVTTTCITPLFLVAGTFFPISQLPQWAQLVANLNPLYQLVELVRGACFGLEPVDALRLLALAVFSLVLWRVAIRFMHGRLID
jgi:lipooligosaccharide transport system permease protein